LEDETFGEFYSKMSDLRNQMVSLGKTISNVKLIRKILRSLLERFRIKVTSIEESKDLEEMKIEELVGSLQTYELSLPPIKKLKTIALKASKKKVEVSSGDDSEDEEKAVAILAKIFNFHIDCWSIIETGWTKPADTTLELVTKKNTRLSNDKSLHALCQALSPS
jgi:hypothetical protein